MKVGDKVYCIKSRDNLNLENRIYTILKIDHNINEIIISIEKNKYYICSHYMYHAITDFDYSEHYVFDEFFITLKEQRKLKLEKLNEI